MTPEPSSVDWQAASTLIAALAVFINAIMAVSILISVRSLRESVAAKESAIMTWAVEKIAQVRPIMNEIRDCGGDKEWMKRHHDEVMAVLDTLQIVSFMALEGVINKDRIAAMWGKSFVEQWRNLDDYVGDFRDGIGEPRRKEDGAFFARSFEEFSSFCALYLKREFQIDLDSRG